MDAHETVSFLHSAFGLCTKLNDWHGLEVYAFDNRDLTVYMALDGVYAEGQQDAERLTPELLHDATGQIVPFLRAYYSDASIEEREAWKNPLMDLLTIVMTRHERRPLHRQVHPRVQHLVENALERSDWYIRQDMAASKQEKAP